MSIPSESMPRTGEATIRRLAVELPRLVPNLSWMEIRKEASVGKGNSIDLIARARVADLTKTILFEAKSIGEPRMAEQAIGELRRMARTRPDAYLVFAAPYISERAREICRSERIGYVDLVGNVYLQFGSVLIDRVSGVGKTIERRGLRSLFAPKATRVARALLEAPEEDTTITRLAQACSMSPAGVYLVVNLLETKGYVTRGERKRIQLVDPMRLLLDWARFSTVERSRASRYFSFEKDPERLIAKISDVTERQKWQYAFTGMAGASLVAPFTRYDDVWLYVGERNGNLLIEELDLRPVSSGANVVFLDPYDEGVFMGARKIRGSRVVSNIQLFVDLYTYPARGREQAEQLLAKAIKFREIN
jgi:hypothetical protein